MLLTDAAIRRAKPGEKPFKLFDGGGLFLLVQPNGSRLWRQKYRYPGPDGKPVEKLLTHGPYPQVTLAEAREKREAAKRLLREGRDPNVERRVQQAAQAAAAGDTFEVVARACWQVKKPAWSDQHAAEWLDSLERMVFPDLGPLPIRTIKAPMVLRVLKAIEDRPAPETARRVRQRISAVFVYAIACGLADDDPAAIVQKAMQPVRRRKQPAITDLERLRQMLRDVEERTPAHPATKLGHRLLALTALRPGCLLLTPWADFSALDAGEPLWRIPPDRLKLDKKNKDDETRELWVPLTHQALDCIGVLRMITGRGPLVLPNLRRAHEPMSENAIGYMLNRAGYYGQHVAHGWRASFSTIMNERYPDDRAIIDLMLGHVPKDKVEAAYNRAAYMARRRELAQAWADMLLAGMPPASSLFDGARRPAFNLALVAA